MIKLFFLFDAFFAVVYLISVVGYLIATVTRYQRIVGLDWFKAFIPFFNTYALYKRLK